MKPLEPRRSHRRMRTAALLLAGACAIAQAQTPAAPTPTSPPEGILPVVPPPPPLPVFQIAPPLPAPAAPAPLVGPRPSPGMPRPRPSARVHCSDPEDKKLAICRQE